MQNVPGEVEHCLGRNSQYNLKEEGVSPPIPTRRLGERNWDFRHDEARIA
jgi:hypothetical protein